MDLPDITRDETEYEQTKTTCIGWIGRPEENGGQRLKGNEAALIIKPREIFRGALWLSSRFLPAVVDVTGMDRNFLSPRLVKNTGKSTKGFVRNLISLQSFGRLQKAAFAFF